MAPEHRALAEEALPRHQPLATNLHSGPRPTRLPLATNQDPVDSTPPAVGVCPVVASLPSTTLATTSSLVGLPAPRPGGLSRTPEDTFPKGPIREVMKAHL